MTKPKILYWDLETLPCEGTFWGIYDQRLGYENIKTDWSIACAAWQFEGGKVDSCAVRSSSVRDDRNVVSRLRDVVGSADVLVHHNGDEFDIKKLNARIAFHGMRPLPPARTIDTKKLAKRVFGFTCNRLDYLGGYLKIGRKIETGGYKLWLDVLDGDQAALQRMVKYNVGDVKLLREIYLKLRAFDPQHPNSNLWSGGSNCPTCGGGVLTKAGFKVTRSRTYQRWQCNACGAYSSATKATASVAVA